ncbi:oligosaccharide flippase family protein [uncultured Erythrobacter sp.]|uniref:lipopolysaccharide biosynthesis protein n=1 Tax=uncultured Erythrobacter sp. TaxID=263913 RepID=UPI002613EF94|nr:oligosaccharide flippase family protein [uncultured Erythrobacter sp.]
MGRLFANMGWLLGGRGINAVLSLVYLALATRTLGTEGFGYFALIVALGQTVTGIANFQTWQFVVRWGANGEGPAEATGFAIALDLLSVAMGTVLAGLLVWTAQLWLPLPTELMWLTFGYCIVSLLSIRTTPTGLLRLRFKFGIATAAETVQPVIRAIGALLAVVFMPNVMGFILAWAASEVTVALALWIVAARTERIDLSKVSLTRIPQKHADAWRFVWSTNMSGSLTIASKQVMILLVGAFGGAALAGGFRVASQLGQALVTLAQAISKAILPELVHAKDDALAIARRMANIALVGGVIAVGVSLLFGRWGLELIAGEEFRVFYWAMVILSIAGAVELVGASLESLLVSAGRAGTAFLVRAVPTILALVFLDAAIDWNGAKGAAFAVLGSSSLAVVGFYVAILNLREIKLVVEPAETEPGEAPQKVAPPAE